ncbi:GyrI-like domain-containing protein [Georgenia wangjunii]|uniref:GyrI-like domain-containing protein n=1 Tax=Georgenia wangjunii TaxID=3117730 RepID=UPI002F26B47C
MSTPSTSHLHAADEPELALAPAVTYASIRGSGAPGTDEFYRKKALIGAVARELSSGAAEPVIEIQYWYPEGAAPVGIADFYSVNPVPALEYRVLALVPNGTTTGALSAARSAAASPFERTTDAVELFSVPEHDVVQVMHHGPFAEEFATLARLGEFAASRGVRRNGPHHELHLDGFTRRTPQDTLRTILRDPVA